MDIEKKLDDIFTYLTNVKNKMDSMRDHFIALKDKVETNTQLISELQTKNEKLNFILRNVGTKLEVEIDEPEPKPIEEPIIP